LTDEINQKFNISSDQYLAFSGGQL